MADEEKADYQVDAEVDCVYHERHIRVRFRARPAQIPSVIRRLAELGMEPERAPLRWDLTAEGMPICPRHRVPMKKRERFGSEWYAHNAGTKEHPAWCRGFPSPHSLGYDVTGQGEED